MGLRFVWTYLYRRVLESPRRNGLRAFTDFISACGKTCDLALDLCCSPDLDLSDKLYKRRIKLYRIVAGLRGQVATPLAWAFARVYDVRRNLSSFVLP